MKLITELHLVSEIKNEWRYTSCPHHSCLRVQIQLYLLLGLKENQKQYTRQEIWKILKTVPIMFDCSTIDIWLKHEPQHLCPLQMLQLLSNDSGDESNTLQDMLMNVYPNKKHSNFYSKHTFPKLLHFSSICMHIIHNFFWQLPVSLIIFQCAICLWSVYLIFSLGFQCPVKITQTSFLQFPIFTDQFLNYSDINPRFQSSCGMMMCFLNFVSDNINWQNFFLMTFVNL